MKRILLLLVMMLTFAGANAQKQGFISTGQNVRTGPGKQYPLAKEDFSEEPCQLDKGMLVRYLGKKKNGFCYVEVSSMITEYYCKGWVSAKYLRPVKLCPQCNGEGYTDVEGFCEGKKCTRCGTKVISDNRQILRIINGKRNVCGFFSRFLYVDSLWNVLWPVGHI